MLGRKNLSKSWLPKSFRELYHATLVFQEHMTKAYEGEKQAMMRDDKLENNLMTSLVRASQANVNQKGSTTGPHQERLQKKKYMATYSYSILRDTMQPPTPLQ